MRAAPILLVAAVAVASQLSGCASTNFEIVGPPPKASLCQNDGQMSTALVLWGPVWRPNQKDVPLREAAAQQGIEDFAKHSGCFSKVTIQRLPGGRVAQVPSAEQVREIATGATLVPDRVVVLTVHELGPVFQILGPIAALGGGTEAVLNVQVHDLKAGVPIAERHVHWSNGGSFVIKGTKTLPTDMRSALDALFGLSKDDG